MKKPLTSKDENNYDNCKKFDKLPFPKCIFNPPQKEEFKKRICNGNCRECPFFGWPMPGPQGMDGKDGRTPEIGANGNWWIGDTDSGIPARGTPGQDGIDGLTPTIGANSNWWIGGTDTGVPAEGTPGQDGIDGTNGTDGLTPIIGANGNWWLGGTDTGIPARGTSGQDGIDGTDGADGLNPTIGTDGNWWIGDTATGVPAQGPRGLPGPKGDTGTFNSSSLYVWKTDSQTLSPAPAIGLKGDVVEFTDYTASGTAIEFIAPDTISILETGFYSIRWEIYKSGYDSAFALFFSTNGAIPSIVRGSNYGAMSHDEKFRGQVMAELTEGGILSLNRIDTLNPLDIINQISDGTPTVSASIFVQKIA